MSNLSLMPGEALRQLQAASIHIVRDRTGDGSEIRCRCPQHADPDGHLYVNSVTGAAFCQKCEMRTNLRALCGHSPPIPPEEALRYEILTATAAYYHSQLTEDARRYLIDERKLLPEMLDRFRVGWADGGLRTRLLDEKSFSAEECVAAGVLKRDERGVRDFFYHRIVFPNVVAGRVVHLSGRRIDGGKPKWLHLPGEIAYPYNADALRRPDCLWVEGILDVLSVACWDMDAAAGLGTHAKPEWVERVPDQNRIIVTMDGDDAGRNGAVTVAELLGDKARIASLPPGTDPNDMLREGRRDEFEECLRQAVDLLTYRINQIPADTPRTELPRLLDDVLRQIAATDPASTEAYLGVMQDRFQLRREELSAYRKAVKELRSSSRKSADPSGADDVIYTARFDGLVDLVEHEGEPAFLMVADRELQVRKTVERDGQIFAPPPKDNIPWLLPRADEVLHHHEDDSDGQLWDDLLTYHRGVSELPTEAHYEFIATWVMHTYLLEGVQYSPYLCLYAVPERGKTRTGKAITYVAYRGIHVESLRDAYIVRFAANYGGTLFLDVMGLWRKAEREGTADLLLGRFERGFTVPRVLYPDRGPHRDTVYFEAFGPTLIGTNEAVHHILDTRAVTFTMPPARRAFDTDVIPEAARPLRERLVAFRARHLGEPLPEVRKPAAGRLGDILRPLSQVIRLARPQKETAFLTFVAQLQRERLQEKADTLESDLLRILDKLRDQVESGLLPVKSVTQSLNEGRFEKDQINPQRVGKKLRSLGFDKGERSADGATIRWDDETLARAMESYGLRDSTHSTHSAFTPASTESASVECAECDELVQQAQDGRAHTLPPDPEADSPPAMPPTTEHLRPCYTCGSTRFWLDTEGARKCGTCHPPASDRLVKEWLQSDGEPEEASDENR